MKITGIDLYLNECYGCKSAKYIPLYNWFLSLGLPLREFQSYRVPLKREWQAFAKDMKEKAHIDLPFVVVHTDEGDLMIQYENLKQELERNKMVTPEDIERIRQNILVKKEKDDSVQTVQMRKKKVAKKQAVVKQEKTVSTEVE